MFIEIKDIQNGLCFNSLRTSYAYMSPNQTTIGPDNCLTTVWGNYLIQCWRIVNCAIHNEFWFIIFESNATIFIEENAQCKLASILAREWQKSFEIDELCVIIIYYRRVLFLERHGLQLQILHHNKTTQRTSDKTITAHYNKFHGVPENVSCNPTPFLCDQIGIILYHILLYCIVLWCIVLYCITLYCITLHHIILSLLSLLLLLLL